MLSFESFTPWHIVLIVVIVIVYLFFALGGGRKIKK